MENGTQKIDFVHFDSTGQEFYETAAMILAAEDDAASLAEAGKTDEADAIKAGIKDYFLRRAGLR